MGEASGSRLPNGGTVISMDAEVIDTTDIIVLPGLIDAHRHLFYTSFRSPRRIRAEAIDARDRVHSLTDYPEIKP